MLSTVAGMPPTAIIDSRTWVQRFEVNAAAKVKLASTYAGPVFGVVAGIVVTVWQAMAPVAQTGLIASIGLGPLWSAILLASITHLVATFKPAPAGAVSPQLLDALTQIARLKLNAELRQRGLPEIPEPESALTAEAAVHFVPVPTAPRPPPSRPLNTPSVAAPSPAPVPLEEMVRRIRQDHPTSTDIQISDALSAMLLTKGTS